MTERRSPDAPRRLPAARGDVLERADALAERFRGSAGEHDRAGTFPHEHFTALRSGGWAALTVPPGKGGRGASLALVADVCERFARGDGSTALAMAMHFQTLGNARDKGHWRPETLAFVYDEAVDGKLINACASEPELGSPSRGGLPRTKAGRVQDGWSITGRKTFASMAPTLDYFVIPAAIDGDDEAEKPIGRFLVPRDAGVEMHETWDPMGMRATGSHDISLHEVIVPDSYLLFRQSASSPDPLTVTVNVWFTLCITAVYVGVAAAALESALDYAIERVPTALGRPIASLETIQRRLGGADIELRSARALIQRAARAWDEDPGAEGIGVDVVAAKVVGTNASVRAVDEVTRAAGGASMRRDLSLERHYRDVRAGLFHPPHDDAAAALLGRMALVQRGWRP